MQLYYNGQPLTGLSGGGGGDGVPDGVIVIWSGSAENVPSGWHICDGTNGTPDLRNKFVLGVSESHPVGETGGEEEVTLTVEQMPIHTHSYTSPKKETDKYVTISTTSGTNKNVYMFQSPSQLTGNRGNGAAHPNMPPYYTLCYIMKVSGKEE